MIEIDHLKKLDAAAEREAVPRIDVSGAVMRVIAVQRGTQSPTGVLWVMAAAAVVAAMISVGLAWQDWSGVVDPLHGLFGRVSMVMQ